MAPEDYMEPATSRKLVILSDTRDSSRALPHCADADIVVHEATNAFLRKDRLAGKTVNTIEKLTVKQHK